VRKSQAERLSLPLNKKGKFRDDQRVVISKSPKREKSDVHDNVCRKRHFSLVVSRECPTNQYQMYTPCYIPRYPRSNGLVRFKMSNAWMGTQRRGPDSASLDHNTWAKRGTTFGIPDHRIGHALPLISKNGAILPYTIGVWKCRPNELLTTLVSTIYKRLQKQKWIHYRYKRWKGPSEGQMLRLAFIGALYPDKNYFSIAYGLFKNNPRGMVKYIYKIYKQMDESIRFLFGQLSKSSLWLQHRGKPSSIKSIKTSSFPLWRNPITGRIPSPEELYFQSISQITNKYLISRIGIKKALVMSLQGSQTYRIFTGTYSSQEA
jgi:hypothetical protein